MGLLGRKGQARKPVINIIAILEVKNREEFNKFETQAIQIIRSHGGKLVAAFEPDTSFSSDSDGIEVHYIQFSDSSRSRPRGFVSIKIACYSQHPTICFRQSESDFKSTTVMQASFKIHER